MAKVTELDVVNFLKDKVARLTKELETTQQALNALEESVVTEPIMRRGRKPKAENHVSKVKRKPAVKAGGAKRGRKPKVKETPVEAPETELILQD